MPILAQDAHQLIQGADHAFEAAERELHVENPGHERIVTRRTRTTPTVVAHHSRTAACVRATPAKGNASAHGLTPPTHSVILSTTLETMDPDATLNPGLEITQFSGPVIVGYLLHWGLFGTLSMQLPFPNDRKPIQWLIYTVYLLELVQMILMTHDAFTNFGTDFGNTTTLQGVHFDWLMIPIMSGIVACIGQTFYAYRVYVLSKSWGIPVLIIALLKNDTGLRRTHMLVVKLIRLTIETGSLTAAVALTNLALFFTCPDRPYFFTAGALLPELYASTIFAVLNSRFQIFGGRGSLSENITSHQSIPVNMKSGGTTRSMPPLVTITREIFSDSELDELEMKDPRGSQISGSGHY
ncbi:hypothetical protein MSAN_02468900 [Mycena sanguinolenta]|uniref:DUF6534 domain-containing protein n=1 Tax=Mycena sanguinolenta TaxID=230812 RepID=A0A8H6U2C9_9AGAR|nr:hypothetical protein MSAN_02468900 [Mycena sanguinolenta]